MVRLLSHPVILVFFINTQSWQLSFSELNSIEATESTELVEYFFLFLYIYQNTENSIL